MDLVKRFDQAELRPRGGEFRAAQHTVSGHTRATIRTPPASRMTWATVLPRRSVFRAFVAVASETDRATLRFRVGVGDHRVYEVVSARTVTSGDPQTIGWVPIDADLSLYAGPKLSLFYRPEGRAWRLILSTDQLEGAASGLWGDPGIDTDASAARLFHERYVRRRPASVAE